MRLQLFVYFFLSLVVISNIYAQTDEASIRDHVLSEITRESEEKSKELEQKILVLDKRIKTIDSTLVRSSSERETISKLRERVNILEQKQAAERKKELSIYEANYQTAVINLVSMEREIKPLELFIASKDFYSQLNGIANPMTYAPFRDWYKIFKQYLDKNRSTDAILEVTSKVLATAGHFSKELGIAGAVSDCLLVSVGKFIESLSSKKEKTLREQSRKMLQLTMTLSQYTTDKNLIANEWVQLEKELEELKSLQDTTLSQILTYINSSPADFQKEFMTETNAIKSLNYLNKIKDLAGEKVAAERATNTDNWKDKIYLDMQTVQSLKIRFGQTTTHIHGNINQYQKLVRKYKNDEFLGDKVNLLDTKLKRLSEAFDDTFNPQKYISDAVKMYRVH